MSNNSSRWTNTLDALQRAEWEAYAAATPIPDKFGDPVNIKGRQMYLRTNNALYAAFGSVIDNAPSTPGVAVPPQLILAGDTTNGIQITGVTQPLPVDADVIVRLGIPVNQSRNFYKSPFSFILSFIAGATFPITVLSPVLVSIGQRYYIAARTFEDNAKASFEEIQAVDIVA